MAKTLNVFKKTEPDIEPVEKPFRTWPEDNIDLTDGRILPHGVGLKEGELKALDQIGDVYGVAVNGLIRYAVQQLILEWREGRVDLRPSIRRKSMKRNSGKPNELKMPIE